MHECRPGNPHGHFVRRPFDVADHTPSLLKTYLPAPLLHNLRPETLEHKSCIDRHIALQLLSDVLKLREGRKRNRHSPCVLIRSKP